ncbi:hypothetical protein SAMN06272775_2206 [Streptomyces sp. 2323.1]|nr:hypothetical protein SAMN06272775_2206 [Streptomyces sp. 2323.1]
MCSPHLGVGGRPARWRVQCAWPQVCRRPSLRPGRRARVAAQVYVRGRLCRDGVDGARRHAGAHPARTRTHLQTRPGVARGCGRKRSRAEVDGQTPIDVHSFRWPGMCCRATARRRWNGRCPDHGVGQDARRDAQSRAVSPRGRVRCCGFRADPPRERRASRVRDATGREQARQECEQRCGRCGFGAAQGSRDHRPVRSRDRARTRLLVRDRAWPVTVARGAVLRGCATGSSGRWPSWPSRSSAPVPPA